MNAHDPVTIVFAVWVCLMVTALTLLGVVSLVLSWRGDRKITHLELQRRCGLLELENARLATELREVQGREAMRGGAYR